ncbi:unnamed protein product [Cuscuta campestris]|uniref:Cyclin-dependent kinase inhibitor domain-containing protein n=1 Tax=Cuscuta campestris TaxID=132261 RepID=A0A484L6Z0_9ASTE|nr:unnamed protein product [Cuscuta campestris]
MEEYLEGISATMIEFCGREGALKTAMVAVDVSPAFIGSNKRKKSVGVCRFGDPSVNCSGNYVFPADSARSGRVQSARLMARNVVVKDMRRSSPDLQQEDDFVTVDSSAYGSFSELQGETVEIMESSSTEKKGSTEAIRRRRRGDQPAGRKPPEAEIEEFFADAEKYEQKKFLEKYNYDVVKDAPLEGRYQWVRLNSP